MFLTSQAQSVAFATPFNADKIVGVWEGSYNRATQVTARAFTLSGLPYDVFFFRIAHGLPRPVFCDLLWSSDGVTFSDGGFESIAISDSTYIYIYDAQGVAAAGTAYYKVIAFWIDDYDTTNPSVDSFLSTTKEVNFDSRLNYQKIYQQNVSNFSFSSGVLSEVTNNVTHDLGYRANFRAFYEGLANEVWPLHNNDLFVFDDNELFGKGRMSTTQLSLIQTHPASSTRTSSRVWYKIYLDR